MPTLGQELEAFKENILGAIHLLLIGESKTGKTDYVAQAVNDGYTCLYVDADNGFATIAGAVNPEARDRLFYFAPNNPVEFVTNLLTMPLFRYNISLRETFNAVNAKPDHRIAEFYGARMPGNLILALDSWTSFMFSIVDAKAKKMGVDLSDVDKVSREIYGSTGLAGTALAKKIQRVPFHTIVQGHPVVFERKEKPPGIVRDVKENDMIIKDTKQVPMSTSIPHGASIPKFFNQVGWLTIERESSQTSVRRIDFSPRYDRVGSGTPTGGLLDPRGKGRFSTLFGKPPALAEGLRPWLVESSHAEWKERQAELAAKKAEAKAAAEPGMKTVGSSSTTPKPTPKPALTAPVTIEATPTVKPATGLAALQKLQPRK